MCFGRSGVCKDLPIFLMVTGGAVHIVVAPKEYVYELQMSLTMEAL